MEITKWEQDWTINNTERISRHLEKQQKEGSKEKSLIYRHIHTKFKNDHIDLDEVELVLMIILLRSVLTGLEKTIKRYQNEAARDYEIKALETKNRLMIYKVKLESVK